MTPSLSKTKTPLLILTHSPHVKGIYISCGLEIGGPFVRLFKQKAWVVHSSTTTIEHIVQKISLRKTS